ncbi:Uncharacterised protein [Mycobacteroides abscessus]|nr:Uncharacterised protein [Mycobacteroides abscessus]
MSDCQPNTTITSRLFTDAGASSRTSASSANDPSSGPSVRTAYSNGRRMPSSGLSPACASTTASPGNCHFDGVRGAQCSAPRTSVIGSPAGAHDGGAGGSTGWAPNSAYCAATCSGVGTTSRNMRSSMRPWNGFASRVSCGKLPPILIPAGSVGDVAPAPHGFEAVYRPSSSSPLRYSFISPPAKSNVAARCTHWLRWRIWSHGRSAANVHEPPPSRRRPSATSRSSPSTVMTSSSARTACPSDVPVRTPASPIAL